MLLDNGHFTVGDWACIEKSPMIFQRLKSRAYSWRYGSICCPTIKYQCFIGGCYTACNRLYDTGYQMTDCLHLWSALSTIKMLTLQTQIQLLLLFSFLWFPQWYILWYILKLELALYLFIPDGHFGIYTPSCGNRIGLRPFNVESVIARRTN